ncbi:MAG: DUF5107 domain-containing protein [Planctomycetota bacterium]|jgi:hypothetical protein
MTELRLGTLTMPAASMGAESPWPAMQPPGKHRFPREDIAAAKEESLAHAKNRPDPGDPAVRYGGMYDLPDCLPYAVQDGFNRDRRPREFQVAVLENEHLTATFILALGGRLWSLVHKSTGKQLVDPNAVFQPTLLARRGAWISGGCEWNATPGGHSPQNCDAPFAALLTTDDGAPVLRLYEWERIAEIGYQVDCWLPDDSEFLYARVRVTNPHDRTVPMYWWTNIAVDLVEGRRVIVPANDALSWGYAGPASTVPIPLVGDVDVSWPMKLGGTCDFYYGIPDNQRPWIAYLDEDGQGLVHASTSRLCGRKLFVWGTGAGGQHWQEFLSPGGVPYIELQAGLTQTQYTTIAMEAGADWAWVEAFGLLSADPAKAHSPDWQTAVDEVSSRIDPALPQEHLEALLRETEAMADRPADEIIQRGSGWGALERRRRELTGQTAGWPASLVFDDESLTDTQTPWLAMLDSGTMAEPAGDDILPSFMIQDGWLELLEKAVEDQARDNWYAWLQLGILRYSQITGDADVDGAIAAWRRSLEIKETPWAHRNLAVAAWHAGEKPEAADQWLRAWQLRCGDPRLAKEASKVLIRTGKVAEFLAMLDILPPEVKADVRLDIYRVICLLEKDDPTLWPEVEAFLSRPHESVDTHEGEPTLSNIFYEFEARKLAAAENAPITEDHRTRVRDELAVPAHLDFRQIRDPAFDKAKEK